MDRRTLLKTLATMGVAALAGCGDADGSSDRSKTPPGVSTDVSVSDGRTPAIPTATPTPDTPTATRRMPTDSCPPDCRPTEPPPTEPEPTPTQLPTPEGQLTNFPVEASDGDEVSDLVGSVESGERLAFPPGRFRWSEEVVVTAHDWGIRCHDDTVFEVPAGFGDGDNRKVLLTHDGDRIADNVHLENLTFDSPGRASPSVHISVENEGRVDGLHYRMNGPLSTNRQENAFRGYVENASGRLVVEDLRQFNNGDLGGYGGGNTRVGIYVPPTSWGTVFFRNPVLQGFPNNACYVSRQPGTVVIDGGLILNNNVSAVRVSGSVLVRNTTVYIDIDRYLDGDGKIDQADHNTRGFWGDNRKAGNDGGLVTGVSCILKSYRASSGLATILQNPKMRIQNSQFLLDADIKCVQAFDGEISIAECGFDGSSAGSTAGVGDITGPGGKIARNIDPGTVPVKGRQAKFDWSWTHPETPGRPADE